MSLHKRIGIDLGRKVSTEDGIAWAAANDVHHIDSQIDLAPNALATMLERAPAIRDAHESKGINLALHTLSGVNVAEISPYMSDAVDQYLRSYIDVAALAGASWIVVHGGYHFTDDYEVRRSASIERLKRAGDHAEKAGVTLLLENMNREPDQAEVKYLCSTLEECQYYFDKLESQKIRPPTTPISGRSASTAFSTFSISPAATRSVSPTAVAMSRNICNPGMAASTSPPCSSASKAWASKATTPTPSAASTTCSAVETIWSSKRPPSGSPELADTPDFSGL